MNTDKRCLLTTKKSQGRLVTGSCLTKQFVVCQKDTKSCSDDSKMWGSGICGDKSTNLCAGFTCSKTCNKCDALKCPYNCDPTVITPVCGNNGRTYSSPCSLEEDKCTNRKLTIVHHGSCVHYPGKPIS